MCADQCSASGLISARFPGHDVASGDNLGQQLITAGAAEYECLRVCLEEIANCASAVLVTNSAGTVKTCYFKGAGIESRVSGKPARFVLLGCEPADLTGVLHVLLGAGHL